MRTALKEWAIVVEALGSGEQIVVLRKGGVREGPGGFSPEHPQFWLFPTRFHQQRESVIPAAQSRFDQIRSSWPDATRLRLEFWAQAVVWRELDSLAAVERLRGQHIWQDEAIRRRFDWGRERGIYALALRVHRLPAALELPMLPGYGGCKSWIELAEDVNPSGAKPVLSDDAFASRLEEYSSALERIPASL